MSSLTTEASHTDEKLSLKGKTALITGASRGIGEQIAYAYAREGAKLILVAQREDALKEVASACKGAPDTEVHALSLSDDGAVDKMAKAVLDKHGRVDVIVNNAGVLGPFHEDLENLGQGPLEGNPDEWNEQMHINVLAPMRLLRWLGPAMVENGEGAIVNIASIAGTKGMAANISYSTSKNAMTGWSEAVHDALSPKGIKVIAINPAAVATPMTMTRPDMAGKVDPTKENQAADIAQLALLPFKVSRWCGIRELTTTNMVPIMKD
ncbi:hypothetical protein WJX73_007987 [Symbiochloris irregularis]|uniref:Uncharacterized protein n=1 Tax=Symbiochloris irregularis TaxID=706552 RepID=A0AAW1PDS1_9CHLO